MAGAKRGAGLGTGRKEAQAAEEEASGAKLSKLHLGKSARSFIGRLIELGRWRAPESTLAADDRGVASARREIFNNE